MVVRKPTKKKKWWLDFQGSGYNWVLISSSRNLLNNQVGPFFHCSCYPGPRKLLGSEKNPPLSVESRPPPHTTQSPHSTMAQQFSRSFFDLTEGKVWKNIFFDLIQVMNMNLWEFLFNLVPNLCFLVIQKVWGMSFFNNFNPLKRNCNRKNSEKFKLKILRPKKEWSKGSSQEKKGTVL